MPLLTTQENITTEKKITSELALVAQQQQRVSQPLQSLMITPSFSRIQARPMLSINNTFAKMTGIEPSVVQIRIRGVVHNSLLPWQAPSLFGAMGSGFIVKTAKGLRIITNAHVVHNYVLVQVRLSLKAEWYNARVEIEGHECDLAMLSVEAPTFWQQAKPLEIGEIPGLNENINVVGFPMGGTEMTVTKGITSRWEFNVQAHGGAELLNVQIDASINSGNSGGPVIINHQVVGVAHQKNPYGEGQGYMIPATTLKHFIKQAEAGPEHYKGFPYFPITLQPMVHSALRSHYGLKTGQSGVLISEIKANTTVATVLEKNDILLSIDNCPINNDGTVIWHDRRVSYMQLIHEHFVGEKISLKVLRNKEEKNLELILEEGLHQRVKKQMKEGGGAPSYYICSGLVLQELTWHYWRSLFNQSGQLALDLLANLVADKTLIVLGRVLPSCTTEGYEHLFGLIIKEINGKKINCLKEAIDALEGNTEDEHLFLLQNNLPLPIKNLKDPVAQQEMLDKYSIPCDRSQDLKPKSPIERLRSRL